MDDLKPKKRSQFRIAMGKAFYRSRRYMDWYLSGKKFSKKTEEALLPCVAFAHQTPLFRVLKEVDMWMQHNKVNNLRIAAQRLNQVIIEPGEIFSYWKFIGKPTQRKGYRDGMVLFYGGFRAGVGGGLCQLSNLIYWMVLHTPLRVVERYRHSFDVFPDSNRTQPFGSGATCVYNYRDLQIYNDTNDRYQLHVFLTDEYLCGEWRTSSEPQIKYEVYEKDHFMNHEIWGGYTRHNTIYRRAYEMDGTFIRDEYVTENHAVMMYQPFLSEKSCVERDRS